MSLSIPEEEQEKILNKIESDESPVGIDAGKTHMLILHKLQNIEQRLEALEIQLVDEEK